MNNYVVYRDMQGNIGAELIPEGYSFDEVSPMVENLGMTLIRNSPIVGKSEQDVFDRIRKADTLRDEGAKLNEKANELAKNPRMQEDQVSGAVDALGVGLSRFAFPISSELAEKGGSEENILKSVSAEAPLSIAMANPANLGIRKAITQMAIYGAGTYGTREAGGQDGSLIESGVAGAIPLAGGVGSKLAQKFGKTAEEIAPNILHSTVVPKSGMMKGANPPDFEVALKEGLVPNGATSADQIKGFEQNIEKRIKETSADRASIPSWKEGSLDLTTDPFVYGVDEISKMSASPLEKQKMYSELEKLQKSYENLYGNEPVSVETAMNERTALGAESGMFEKDIDDSPAMKKVKKIIRDKIGESVKESYPEIMDATSKIAPYMALKKPVANADALSRGKTIIPLGLTQATMAGAMTGGPVGAVIGAGAHQLAKTPYGARRVYNMGIFAQKEYPKVRGVSRVLAEKGTSIGANKLSNKDYGK